MRDIIWTLIVVWLVYKLVDIFKSSPKKSYANNSSNPNTNYQSQDRTNFSSKKDTKEAIQKSADKEGDYVDFEEIK